jgi:phage shock protein A
MEIKDLIELLQNANQEQLKVLRETVAPDTKLARLQKEASDLATKANNAMAKVNEKIGEFARRANIGDLTVVPPTWEELVRIFSEA